MDSIAVQQGLIAEYQLYENEANKDWKYLVAVQYLTEDRYASIEQVFNQIRQAHGTIKINGLVLSELGSVIESEEVAKKLSR